MKLFKTTSGIIIEHEQTYYFSKSDWDDLINRENLSSLLLDELRTWSILNESEIDLKNNLMAPVGNQEVWAAGVTYLRSKNARIEESKDSGGGTFYDKVYKAERPELFFKSAPQRVVGHGFELNIRKDSNWNVPEPELTLFINSKGSIEAYTIGNDMSSRSIEGENPLYLPQAKVYDKSAGLGPCLYVPANSLPGDTRIQMSIRRNNKELYSDSIAINKIKRKFTDLAEYLFRETSFPYGCFLMTGTCLVPSDEFTLQPGDEIRIDIDHIGTLINKVNYRVADI